MPALHTLILFAILTSLLGSAVTVIPVYAAGISVTTTSDEYNAGGECSLREAITAANTNMPYGGCSVASGADTITLPAGFYTLTITGTGENANATGDLDITEALTINGASAGGAIIRAGATPGSGIDRVLEVIGAGTIVSISGITIAIVKCTSCNGGGVLNAGALSITNSTISGSSATYGGGIFNSVGTLTITNSTFSGNTITGGLGGGINNAGGILSITNSTFYFWTKPIFLPHNTVALPPASTPLDTSAFLFYLT